MDSYSAGQISVDFILNPEQFNRQLELSKSRAASVGLEMERAMKARDISPTIDTTKSLKAYEELVRSLNRKLAPAVDDRALTSLNKHLDLKQKHWAAVKKDFAAPLKPTFDAASFDAKNPEFGPLVFETRGLDAFGLKLDSAIEKMDRVASYGAIAVWVDSSAVEDASAKMDVLLSKERKLTIAVAQNEGKDASQPALRPKIDASSIAKDIAGAAKNIVLAPVALPLRVASNLLNATLFQIGSTISGRFAGGLADALEAKVSERFGSSRLLGQKLGEMASTVDAKALPTLVGKGAAAVTSRIAGNAVGSILGTGAEAVATKAVHLASAKVQPVLGLVDSAVRSEAIEERLSGQYQDTQRRLDRRKQAQEQSAIGVIEASRNQDAAAEAEAADRVKATQILPQKTAELRQVMKALANAKAGVANAQSEYEIAQSDLAKEQAKLDALTQEFAASGREVPAMVAMDANTLVQNASVAKNQSFQQLQLAKNEEAKLQGEKTKLGAEVTTIAGFTIDPAKQSAKARAVQQKRLGQYSTVQQDGEALRLVESEMAKLQARLVKSLPEQESNLKMEQSALGLDEQTMATMSSDQQVSIEGFDLQDAIDRRRAAIFKLENEIENTKQAIAKTGDRLEATKTLIDENAQQMVAASEKLAKANELVGFAVTRENAVSGRSSAAAKNFSKASKAMDAVSPQQYPKAYSDLVERVAGRKLKEHEVPQLRVSDSLPQGTNAAYNQASNQITVRPEAYQQMQRGLLDKQTSIVGAHELQHAAQFGFGSFDGFQARRQGRSVNQLKTTNDLAEMADFVSRYDDNVRDYEIDAELTGRDVGSAYTEEQLAQRIFKSKAGMLGKTNSFAKNTQKKNAILISQVKTLVESNKGLIEPKQYRALLKEIEAESDAAVAQLDVLFGKLAAEPVTNEQELLTALEDFAENSEPQKRIIATSTSKLEKISSIAQSRIAEASTPEAIATRTEDIKRSATAQNRNIKEAAADNRAAIATQRARINENRDRIDVSSMEAALDDLEKSLVQLERAADLKEQNVYNAFVQDAAGMRTIAAKHSAITRISTLAEGKADDIDIVRNQLDEAIAQAPARVEVVPPERSAALATAPKATRLATSRAGEVIGSVGKGMQSFASSPAIQAVGSAAKLGYRALEGVENLALDAIPMGRTLKGVGKNVILPAAAYAALTHAGPMGHAVGASIDSLTSMVTSPIANTLGGSLAGQASSAIGNLLPTQGMAGHILQPVAENLQGAATAAIRTGVTQGIELATTAATAVLGGRAVQSAGKKTIAAALPPSSQAPKALQAPAASSTTLSLPAAVKEPALIEITPANEQETRKAFAIEQPKAAIIPARKPDVWDDDLAEIPFELPKPIEAAKAAVGKSREAALAKVQDVKDIVAKIKSTMNGIETAVQSGDMKNAFNLVRALEDAAARAHGNINEVMEDFKGDGQTRRALGGLKGQITQAKSYATNFYQEAEARASTTKLSGGIQDVIDVSLESKSMDGVSAAFDKFIDHALAKLEIANNRIKSGVASFAEVEEQSTLKETVRVAAGSPKAKQLATDAAAAVGGTIGGTVGAQAGPVAGKAGAYVGAVVGRQAANVGVAYSQASKEVEAKSNELQRQVEILKKTISGLSSGELGVDQKDGLFGDTMGWLTSLVDPTGGISAVAIVPALQKARDQLSSKIKAESLPGTKGEFGSLASLNGGGLSPDELKRLREAEKQLKVVIDQLEAWDRAVAKMNATSINKGVGAITDAIDPVKTAESEQIPAPIQLKDRNLKSGVSTGVISAAEAKIEQKFRDAGLDGPTQELSVQDAEKLKQMEARIERKYQSLFRRQKSDRIQPPGKVQLNYTPETQAIVGEIETEQKFREFEARAYASDQLGGKEQNHSDGWVRRKTRAIQRRLGMKPSEIKDQEVESRFQQIELEAAAKVSTPQNDQNPDSVVAQLDQQVADQQAKKNASKLKKLEAKIAKRSKKIAKTNKDNQIELSDRIKRLMLVYDPDSEFDTIRGGPPTGPNDPNNPANTGRQKMRLQNIQAQLAAEPPKPTSKIPAIFQGVAAAGLVALAAPKIIDFTRQQGAAAMNEYIDANKQQTAMSYALGGATRGQQAYGYAKGVAKDLGIDQKSSIRGYSQLATATKGTSLEGQGAADLFEGLSSASTVLGLSADDTSGAMNALVQMMSKGKVQAEELRGQLGERIPGAFSLFAKAIGVSEAQLNKMMERGEVIASATLPKFAAELKRTFGPDAANASQNMQSSMFRLQGQFQDLQVATMSAIAPALNEGISLVTSSMQILTAILPQLLSLLGAIGIALVSKIAVGAVAAAGGIKAIAEASLEIGKKALPSLVSMGAQMIAITAAIEVLKNIWAGFGSSELGKGFEQAGERAIATLERVKGKAIETKDAVGKALGEDPNNGFKPQDMVDSVISSGNNFAKSMRDTYGSTFDNAGKVLNNASPVAFIGTQARQGLGIEDRETGRIKLSSERQFDNDLRLANEGANANALSVGGASPARYKEALQAAATIDAQISPLTDRRAFLTGLKKPSEDQKAELKKVNEEFNRLSKEQTTAGSKAENEYNLAAGAKKAAEDQIAQINADKTLSDENKKKLLKPWEDVLKISTPVVARMDEIRSAVNTAANAGTNLAGAFADVADAIDEAQRAAARFAAVEGLKTTKAELKGQFTDSLVGQRTAVSRAQTDVKAADMLAAAGAEGLKAQEAAVNTNAVKSKLASIPTANNVPLTLDASLKDIESAKKGLGQGAADAEKRDLLDSLKSFKEAKDKQVELENNAQQARIKVIQATEALTLASIDREAGRRELATRRIEAKEAAKVGGRDMTIKAKLARKDANYDQQDANVDLTQNAIARAQLQARSVDRQEAETKRQLQDLEKNKGKITAAEFERRKIGLESTLIDLGGKKQDAQAGIQDAKIAAVDAANNRILDRQQFANRQAASKIETSKSEGSIAIQRGTLASLTGGQRLDQEQADLANIGVNANANKAERAQIEAEIQQVKGNEKAKIITRRESVEQQIALQQRLTSSVAAGLDLEIQRQQKLRDIAMRAIQDRIDASERASRVAQSGLQRELEMAVNYAQKRLELQEQLISSQAELSQSRFALTQTQGEGSIKQADEALSLRKKIDEKDANPLVKEAAQRQLRQLGFSSSSTEADIIATKDSREATLARSKMDALLREESIQSRLLEFEMKKLEFASRSAEIEAKKAELLAKQAENAANLKLELANAMAPGKERDRAIAEAKAEKTMATDGIAIAAEQAKLAKEQAALIPQLKADKQERIALDSQKAKLELGQQEGERRRARELEYAGAKGATGPLGGIVNDFAIAASPASIATQKSAMMGTAFADKGGLTQAQAIAALGSAELQRKLFGNDVVQTRGSLGKLNQDYGPRGGALSQPQAQDVLGSQALQRDVFGESAIKAQATNTEALGKLTEAIKAIPVPARTDSLPRRASGGPGIGGQSYLVGELGPEVFTAPFDGRFLPNSAITPIPSAPPAQSLNSAGPAVPELASTMKDLAREIKGLAASAVAAARVPRSLTVQGVEEPAKAAASIWAENASDRITNAGL